MTRETQVSKTPSVAYSVTIRAEYANQPGMLGQVSSAIGAAGGDITAVDIASSDGRRIVRTLTLNASDQAHVRRITRAVRKVAGVRMLGVTDEVFRVHSGGKIEVRSKVDVRNRNDLSLVYTPGVGRVSMAVHDDPDSVWSSTIRGNSVAVVSDGTAVLGLGDIGPEAAMPVMEGKAMLFKQFAGIDAWPICLATKDPDRIVETVLNLAPTFGGVNLEDISAPRCFDIEERLREELPIPVMHDDQHGTAVVVLAGLLNALRVVGKRIEDIRAVVLGAGAGGSACARIMLAAGARNVVVLDRQGILTRRREYPDNPMKRWLAEQTNPDNLEGGLDEAITGADFFLGLSGPGLLSRNQVARMAADAVVFALSNPDPEVHPDEVGGLVRVMATGRSDFPNQVNNALCFPGVFRGALDVRASGINEEMKLAAAHAIAAIVSEKERCEEYVIPSIFNPAVAPAVARAASDAAIRTGVARAPGGRGGRGRAAPRR